MTHRVLSGAGVLGLVGVLPQSEATRITTSSRRMDATFTDGLLGCQQGYSAHQRPSTSVNATLRLGASPLDHTPEPAREAFGQG
jgi:hypothetical protein